MLIVREGEEEGCGNDEVRFIIVVLVPRFIEYKRKEIKHNNNNNHCLINWFYETDAGMKNDIIISKSAMLGLIGMLYR